MYWVLSGDLWRYRSSDHRVPYKASAKQDDMMWSSKHAVVLFARLIDFSAHTFFLSILFPPLQLTRSTSPQGSHGQCFALSSLLHLDLARQVLGKCGFVGGGNAIIPA